MATNFKAGDIVQLKSGGPAMTINGGPDSSGYYHCTWFRGASQEYGSFKADTLKEYEAPKA